MSLKTQPTGQSMGTYPSYADHRYQVVVDERPVVAARAARRPPRVQNWNDDDIGVILTLENGDFDWQPELYLGGRFARDKQTGRITGWGGAFRVNDLLVESGALPPGEGLTEDDQIPRAALEALVGRSVIRLRYPYAWEEGVYDDKPKYSDFSRVVFRAEGEDFQTAAHRLVDSFAAEITRGFPKDYRRKPGSPSLSAALGSKAPNDAAAAEADTTRTDPFAGTGGERAAVSTSADDAYPDDDLPF